MKSKFKFTIGTIIAMIVITLINIIGNYSFDYKSFKYIKNKDYDLIKIDTNSKKIIIYDDDDKNDLASIVDDTVIYPKRFSEFLETNKKQINIYIYEENEIKSELNYNIEDNVVYGRYFWLGLNNSKFRDYIRKVLND